MSSEKLRQLKPFFSILLIIFTLFSIVFLHMEERRMGYVVLKRSREHKKVLEEKRVREIALAKVTRPQLLDHMAQQKFTLKRIQANQIIHLGATTEKVVSKNLDNQDGKESAKN